MADPKQQVRQTACWAIPVTSDGPGDWDTHLRCPVCSHGFVHPRAVTVNPAGDFPGQVKVDQSGVHLDQTIRPQGRGVKILLEFTGECGHMFAYELAFHKGWTFFRYRECVPSDIETIWRD